MFWIAFGKSLAPKVEDSSSTQQCSKENLQAIYVQYAALADKRSAYDQMLWQSPMIAMTAQAFLLQIAYSDYHDLAKNFCGVASYFIGYASLHLFIRHAAMEKQASIKLESMEKQYKFPEKIHCASNLESSCLANTPAKPIWRRCLLATSVLSLVPLSINIEHIGERIIRWH